MTALRLWNYAKKYKKLVILSLAALIISIAIELALPLIFTFLLDNYIVGVENTWYEVDSSVKGAVYYDENYYAQETNIPKNLRAQFVTNGREATVLLIDNKFIFIDSGVVIGSDSLENNQLVVTDSDHAVYYYDYVNLDKSDVIAFYTPAVHPIVLLIIINIVLNLMAMVITYIYRIAFFSLGNKVTYDIRKEAFEKIQKLHVSYFDKIPAGKIVARVTNDTQTIIDLFSGVLVVFLSAIVYFFGIYIGLFILNVQLAAISLAIIPIVIVWGYFYVRAARRNNQVVRAENSEINAYLNQSIKGMEVIQAFNREDLSFDEFQEHNSKYFQYRNKMVRLNSTLSGNLVNFLQRTIYTVILLYFGWNFLQIQHTIEIGILYAFISYMNKLINPINQIFGNVEQFQISMVSCDRIFYLLDQDEITLYNDTVERFKGDIEFNRVNFAYEPGNYVLKDISLNVRSGETVAIVGHTGSGKSSMMNVMLRFYDYEEGKIMIDGKDIREYTKQAYRRHVGIVLQDPVLFTGTIASNISLNNPLITDEMILDVLKQIGAEGFVNKFVKGIHEPVLDMGTNFSTGERQLISFARVMVYNPAVLVLDEATANIDTETEQLIQKALSVVKRNRTTFIIAHRLSTIKDADSIIVLEKGVIIERGTHEALLEKKGKYYEMYQSQLNEI